MQDHNVVSMTPELDVAIMQSAFALAKRNPLYSDFYADAISFDNAPVLTKHELIPILKNRFDLHLSVRDAQAGVYLVRSGGSTQDPLVFPVDIQENQALRIAMAKELVTNGFFDAETVALNIFAYSDMYRTAAIMDDILEKCGATTLAMGSHATYKDMCHAAQHFKPNFLLGTPSKLLCLAQYARDNDVVLGIKNLFFAGEFIPPTLQKYLQPILGFDRVYSMYGSAETGIWAWSVFSERPSLFSVVPGVYVEIMHPDAQGYGVIAVTNTYRKRFPVFRYAIGDVGRWVRCGEKSYLELKSREPRSFTVWEEHFDIADFQSITQEAQAFQFQIFYSEKLQVVVRLSIVQQIEPSDVHRFIAHSESKMKSFFFGEDVATQRLRVEVCLVRADDLYQDPVTAKTPLIWDRRV